SVGDDAPLLAAIVAPALRSPCARPGTPASTQRSRNQLPKPLSVKPLPNSVTRLGEIAARRIVDCRLQDWKDGNFAAFRRPVAVLVLGEAKLTALSMLLSKPNGVGLAGSRKQDEVQREPRLGADRMTFLILQHLVHRPRMPASGLEVEV